MLDVPCRIRFKVSLARLLIDVRVKDPDVAPVGLELLDELQVIGDDLIDIVRRLVGEIDVQSDVVHAVIHRTSEFVPDGSSRKELHAGVVLQVLVTSCDQSLDLRGRGIFEREKDVVCQHETFH